MGPAPDMGGSSGLSLYAIANTMIATMNAMDSAKMAIAASPSRLVLSCADGSFGVRIRSGLIGTRGRDVRPGTLVPEPAGVVQPA